MTNKHWFLVASQKEARIFIDASDRRPRLELVKSIRNPLGEEKRSALFRKQAGRGVRTVGARGAVHFLNALRSDPREEELSQFARQIVTLLESDLQHKAFKTLSVIAEPHLLGKIKSEMGKDLANHVIDWRRKDFQKTPSRRLAEYLIGDETS